MVCEETTFRDLFSRLVRSGFQPEVLADIEATGVLENVLWPQFPDRIRCLTDEAAKTAPCWNPEYTVRGETDEATWLQEVRDAVLVLAALINEKARQRLDVWRILRIEEEDRHVKLRVLFYSAWLLFLQPQKFDLTSKQLAVLVELFIYTFHSLEYTAIRRLTMSVCGIAAWNRLGPEQKSELLKQRPELANVWKAVARRDRKLTQHYGQTVTFYTPNVALADRFLLLDRDALPAALDQHLHAVERDLPAKVDPANLRQVSTEDWTTVNVFSGSTGLRETDIATDETAAALTLRNENSTDVTADDFLFCERFLEFLIDLLSQLPTRRFFRPVFLASQLLPRLRLSPLYSHVESNLIRQLATLLSGYEIFEVDDATGDALETRDIEAEHYARVKELQLVLFRSFKDVAFLQKVKGHAGSRWP